MDKLGGIIQVDEIKKRLSPLFGDKGLKLVMVFGSVAAGKTRGRSDIDIAFLYEDPVDILDLTNRVIRLLRTDDIDIVDLGRASPLLRFSAAKNCKVIYENPPGVFSEFYSLAFRRYVDTKKLRDAGRDAIKDFLRSRGLE
ncbi:MAG: nucleotidyltransferase domain-containing protein [Deltaproteobacteria bacterium]|nr:nucleotidyltransferase domain-containing protein [Deltaproteobacteria bacterium]